MKKNNGKVVNFSMYSGYNLTKELDKKDKVLKQEKIKEKPIIRKSKKNKNKKNGKKWKIKIFLFLLFVLALSLFCLFTPLFNIEKIEVKGVSDNISQEEVKEALNEAIEQVKTQDNNQDDNNFKQSKYTKQDIINMSQITIGNNIFKESLEKVKENIQKGSYIKKVKIARKFPSTILITITEREIKGYVNYVGTYMCIDETGFVVDSINKQDKKEGIPIIDGINPADLSKGFQIAEILNADDPIKLQRVINILSLIEKNEININISKINVEEKDNVIVTIENGDKEINFGDMTNINIKIAYLKGILEKTVGKKGIIYMNSQNDDLKPVFAERIGE